MYDFSELRAYAEATADAMDKQRNYEKVVARRKVDEGWVVVSHTGGGNQPDNRIYDYLTGETLATLPDTSPAMDEAWQDNWYHADRLAEDAHELFEFPNRESYLTHTGGMPQPMFNAIAKWIEEEDDAAELRRFANDT